MHCVQLWDAAFWNLKHFHTIYIIPTVPVTQARKSLNMQSLYKDPAFYFGILAKRTQYKVSVKNTGTQFKTNNNFRKSDIILCQDWAKEKGVERKYNPEFKPFFTLLGVHTPKQPIHLNPFWTDNLRQGCKHRILECWQRVSLWTICRDFYGTSTAVFLTQ